MPEMQQDFGELTYGIITKHCNSTSEQDEETVAARFGHQHLHIQTDDPNHAEAKFLLTLFPDWSFVM